MQLLLSLALFFYVASFSNALPLDNTLKPRQPIVPRAKSYSIVNVDGDATATPPPDTVVETAIPTVPTKTILVTDVAGPTVTATVVTTNAPGKTPSQPSSSTSSVSSHSYETTPSSTSQSSATTPPTIAPSIPFPTSSMPLPIKTVTVTAPAPTSSTDYYDDGMWHTKYPVQSFETVSLNTTTSSITPTAPLLSVSTKTRSPYPTLSLSPGHSWNQTQVPGRH